MEVKATLDRYHENLHQQVQSLHSSLIDETKFPYLGEPPWKDILWIGTTEGIPFQTRIKRQVGADHWQLFFISGQEYYHIPFVEWVMKKLFKMSGPDPGDDEYMAKGVQFYIKHLD